MCGSEIFMFLIPLSVRMLFLPNMYKNTFYCVDLLFIFLSLTGDIDAFVTASDFKHHHHRSEIL